MPIGIKFLAAFTCIISFFFLQCAEQKGESDNEQDVNDEFVLDSEQLEVDENGIDDKGKETQADPEINWLSLEFHLNADSAAAGAFVSFTAELLGDDGSSKPVNVTIESDQEPGITYDSSTVTATVAQIHNLTATAVENEKEFTAHAVLSVAPGEPASIEMELLPTHPEVNTPLFIKAVIKDVYGNVCNEKWKLSATAETGYNASSVLILGKNVLFTKDGWFTLVLTANSNGLTQSLGPILVDSNSPNLTVIKPNRGTFSTEYEETVEGTATDALSGIAEATVNGTPVDVDNFGAFSEQIDYEFGLNSIETLVTDGDGNVTSDRRSVLAGNFKPLGSGIGNGIEARLNQDTITFLEESSEELIKNADINSSIPNPVFHSKKDTCVVIPWVGEQCVRWYELNMSLTNVTLQDADLTIDPLSNGTIQVTATIFNIQVPWEANGVIAEIPYSGSGTVSAESITVTTNMKASVDNQKVYIDTSDAQVSSTGFSFDFDNWIYDAAKFFGVNVDGLIQGIVEDAFGTVVKNVIPQAFENALNTMSSKRELELFGSTYDVETKPYSVRVDDYGLTLGLETFVSPREWTIPNNGQGSLYYGYQSPDYAIDAGTVIGFSADFINQALYAFWGGGLLEQTIEIGPIKVPSIPQRMDNVSVVTNALLPPVVIPSTGDHHLNLQGGGIKLDLYGDDPSNPNNRLAIIYVGFNAEMTISVSDKDTLVPEIVPVKIWSDLVEPTLPSHLESDLENLAKTLVYQIIPLLEGAIGSIPMPANSGLRMSSIEIGKDGAENGYVIAKSQLAAQ